MCLQAEFECAMSDQDFRRCDDNLQEDVQTTLKAYGMQVIRASLIPHVNDGAHQNFWHIGQEGGKMTEIVSPVLRGSWAQLDTVSDMLSAMMDIKRLGRGRESSLHLTVDGSCLLSGTSALGALNLLAVWESVFTAGQPVLQRKERCRPHSEYIFRQMLQQFIHAYKRGGGGRDITGFGKLTKQEVCALRPSHRSTKFARSLGTRFPNLFGALMELNDTSIDSVVSVFNDVGERDLEQDNTIAWAHPSDDGFRNSAVNLCHILPIPCCRKCDHNKRANRHTGVEFRVFDLEVSFAQ